LIAMEIYLTDWGSYRGSYKEIGLRSSAYEGVFISYFKVKNEKKFFLAVIEYGILFKVTGKVTINDY